MPAADDTFDYLIVGAGTAGCVLANRLSEDKSVRVGLIEAGPRDSNPFIHVPAAVAALLNHKRLGWGYKTAPQPLLAGRTINIPRGRVLGGCSSTNGMVYFRGQPQDFDDWAAIGNPGWSYREVLPYFIRSENNTEFGGSPYHGHSGPMRIGDVNRHNPLIDVFLQATDSLGYRRCGDFNATLDTEGFGTRQATIHNGRRVSGVTAFLDPIRHRGNLAILTDALVTRIRLAQRRAVGLDVYSNGTTRRIDVRRELILAGGTFGSPQLLLLSGIGDPADLNALGIVVQHELPAVGRNLHDHLAIGIVMKTASPESYGLSWQALPRDVWNLVEYAVWRRGPLASNLFEAMGFLRTEPGLDRPDVQLVFQPATRNPSGFPIPLGHGYAMNPLVLYPKSRGRVTLASPDPHAAPNIDPNLLGDPADIQPLIRAIRISRRILGAPAFARFNAVEMAPGAAVEDDAGLEDYIRHYAVTVHHPVSTCRMGSDSDAVVDPELKVRGIEGLRVADASVFPTLIGGNTNAAVVMIAEKAADLILGRPAPPPLDVTATPS